MATGETAEPPMAYIKVESPVLRPTPSPQSTSFAMVARGGSPRPKQYSYPRNKIKILLMESISQAAVDLLRSEGFQVDQQHLYTKEELTEKIGDYHVIGIRSKTKLREPILKNAKKMICIGHFCIGTDQTDLEIAGNLGIPVFNSPFANTRSVAELCMAHMVVLARKTGDRNAEMHKGIWNKTAKGCYEVRGKTLGIVGYGHVGSQLSILAEAFGMKVVYYDIVPKLPMGNAVSVGSLHDLLSTSDFVSLHVPFTELTENLIDREAVSTMKKGSYLLNAARGKCVDIDAVADALRNEHLAGAFFDVYPSEPIDETCPLRNCPNTILTPHIGGSSIEAQQNIGLEVARKISRFINEGCTLGAVNFPNVDLPNSKDDRHRIIHVHENVPGVLKSINGVLADYNVRSQILSTTDTVGYLMVEVDANKKLSKEVQEKMAALKSTIRSRIIWRIKM